MYDKSKPWSEPCLCNQLLLLQSSAKKKCSKIFRIKKKLREMRSNKKMIKKWVNQCKNSERAKIVTGTHNLV